MEDKKIKFQFVVSTQISGTVEGLLDVSPEGIVKNIYMNLTGDPRQQNNIAYVGPDGLGDKLEAELARLALYRALDVAMKRAKAESMAAAIGVEEVTGETAKALLEKPDDDELN